MGSRMHGIPRKLQSGREACVPGKEDGLAGLMKLGILAMAPLIFFIVSIKLFPILYWAFEVVEEPTQKNIYLYLASVALFLGSSIGWGAFSTIPKKPRYLPFLSIAWLLLSIFSFFYLLSINLEFYPFTWYQVTLFHFIMVTTPIAFIGAIHVAAEIYGKTVLKHLHRAMAWSAIGLLFVYLMEITWWGYFMIPLVVAPLLLSVASTAPSIIQGLLSWKGSTKSPASQNAPVAFPGITIFITNAILLLDGLFSKESSKWATDGAIATVGIIIFTLLSWIIYQARQWNEMMALSLFAGSLLTVLNVLLPLFFNSPGGYPIYQFLVGFGLGTGLMHLITVLVAGTGWRKRGMHAGVIMMICFVVIGIMSVMEPLLGEAGVIGTGIESVKLTAKLVLLVLVIISLVPIIIAKIKHPQTIDDWPEWNTGFTCHGCLKHNVDVTFFSRHFRRCKKCYPKFKKRVAIILLLLSCGILAGGMALLVMSFTGNGIYHYYSIPLFMVGVILVLIDIRWFKKEPVSRARAWRLERFHAWEKNMLASKKNSMKEDAVEGGGIQ
ncbi:hypothetical protein GF325_11150 [Candidatus Bathyarchaeota archaeon]|nr:hypothetical protein [Candidatus Bathyarchaeota archaeon]